MQNAASLEYLIFKLLAISLRIGEIDCFTYQVSLYIMFDVLGKLVPHSHRSVVCFDFSDRELAHGNEGKTHRNERNGFTSSK